VWGDGKRLWKSEAVRSGEAPVPVDVEVAGVEDLLHRVAQLSDDIPQLASLTLRPCVASVNSISVLGARIFVAPTADQGNPLARFL